MRKVVKVFVRSGNFFVFAEKRAYSAAKNHRLELVGGGMNAGETPFEAMLREAKEEEPSGIIAAALRAAAPEPDRVLVHGDVHYIYNVRITLLQRRRLRHDPVESHGFRAVRVGVIRSRGRLSAILPSFTPRTVAIFHAIGLL